MKLIAMTGAAGLALGWAVAGTATAQWVSFTDETATRLTLTSVGAGDGQEKDIASGDLDRDGDLDIIVVRKAPFSNPGPDTHVLLMNDGTGLVEQTGTLAADLLIPSDARDVLIADLDGDLWPDVVICNTFDNPPRYLRNMGNDGMGVWLGLDEETATRFPSLPPLLGQSPGPLFCAVWAEDVTGNGARDLYFGNYNPGGTATEDVLFINDGTGHFTNETVARMGDRRRSAFASGVEIHDMNGDGFNDIVKISTLFAVTPWNTNGIFICFNNGAGVFDTTAFQTVTTAQPYMLTVGDLNDDQMMDIYVASDDEDLVKMAQSVNGDGTINYQTTVLTSAISPRTRRFGGNTKFVDIDSDGDLDAAVAPVDVDIQNCTGPLAGEFCLLRNDGTGTMDDPYAIDTEIHVRPHDYTFVDINNDGCMDIFMGLCTGWQVFIQSNCAVGGCPWDLNGDGFVLSADLAIVLGAWNAPYLSADVAQLLGSWGACP